MCRKPQVYSWLNECLYDKKSILPVAFCLETLRDSVESTGKRMEGMREATGSPTSLSLVSAPKRTPASLPSQDTTVPESASTVS